MMNVSEYASDVGVTVKEILELNLEDAEKEKFNNSCNILRGMLKEIEENN